MSLGGRGCGAATAHQKKIVVTTTASGSMCATGGSMYAELMAMHVPRAEIIRLLLGSWPTVAGMSQYQAEYEQLRKLGVPKPLAHRLAARVANTVARQP